MNTLVRANIPESEIRLAISSMVVKWIMGDETARKFFPNLTLENCTEEIDKTIRAQQTDEEVYINDVYQVAVKRHDRIVHLSIKRRDRKPVHAWRDLQEIKNQIVGEECEGIELYPAESRKVDTACQYHLWVITDTEYRFPLGFNSGRLVSEEPIGKSSNNPITEQDKIRNQQQRD